MSGLLAWKSEHVNRQRSPRQTATHAASSISDDYDIAAQQDEILEDPAPMAIFMAHGESSLDFELRCFVGETSLRLPMTDRLNTLINEELRKRGIKIAVPRREVRIRNETEDGQDSG